MSLSPAALAAPDSACLGPPPLGVQSSGLGRQGPDHPDPSGREQQGGGCRERHVTGSWLPMPALPLVAIAAPALAPPPSPGACLSLTLLGSAWGGGEKAPRVLITKITFSIFNKMPKISQPTKNRCLPPNQAGAHAASLDPAASATPCPPLPASPGSAQHTLGWPLTPEAAVAAWGTEQERGGGR